MHIVVCDSAMRREWCGLASGLSKDNNGCLWSSDYRLPRGICSFEDMAEEPPSQRLALEQEQRSWTVAIEIVSGSWCGAAQGGGERGG
jgi:hypothetical protein